MGVTSIAAPETAQEAINGTLYRESDLVRYYAAAKLHPPEATALVRYRDDVHGRRVLDLGCGAGRLTTYLRPLVKEYVGLDVSTHMVGYCRKAFPGLEFHQGDMRDLTLFESQTFDTVFAVANLFDAVSHKERLQVLSEVRRVLVPGGLLIFSTHNRNYEHAGAGPTLSYHRNPITQAHAFLEYLQASANHRRIKPFHKHEADYALLNDSGNNYVTLHYYVTREVQARQLVGAGFELVECLGDFGETIRPGESAAPYPSLHYVARRDD